MLILKNDFLDADQITSEDCDSLLSEFNTVLSIYKDKLNNLTHERIGEDFSDEQFNLYSSIPGVIGTSEIKTILANKNTYDKNTLYSIHGDRLKGKSDEIIKVKDKKITLDELDIIYKYIQEIKKLLDEKNIEDQKEINDEDINVLSGIDTPHYLEGNIGKYKEVAVKILPILAASHFELTDEIAENATRLVEENAALKEFLGGQNIVLFLMKLRNANKIDSYVTMFESITSIPYEYDVMTINEFLANISQEVHSGIDDKISIILSTLKKDHSEVFKGVELDINGPLTQISNDLKLLGLDDNDKEVESFFEINAIFEELKGEMIKLSDLSLYRKIGKTLLGKGKPNPHAYQLHTANPDVFEKKILTQVLGSNYSYKGLENFTLDELHNEMKSSIEYTSPDKILESFGHTVSSVNYDFSISEGEKSGTGPYDMSYLEENKYLNLQFPKIKYLAYVLEEEGIENKFEFISTLSGRYKYVYMKDYKKTIVISDDYGFGTYIYDGEINIEDFMEHGLNEVADKDSYVMVKFFPDKDPDQWKINILTALQKENVKYDSDISKSNKIKSSKILTNLVNAGIFNINDYTKTSFDNFISQWNSYLDSIVKDIPFTGKIEDKYIQYIDEIADVKRLYLHGSMSVNPKGNINNPFTIQNLLNYYLEKSGIQTISTDDLSTLNGSPYFTELIDLLLQYSQSEDLINRSCLKIKIDKLHNLILSRNLTDYYVKHLVENIYTNFSENELETFYAGYTTGNNVVKKFKDINMMNINCFRSLQANVGYDCLLDDMQDVGNVFEKMTMRNDCTNYLYKNKISATDIDNLIYDFEGFLDGKFVSAFGNFETFYVFIGGNLDDIIESNDDVIHNFINKIFIANSILNTVALTEDFTSKVQFQEKSTEELLKIINSSNSGVKDLMPSSKISLKGVNQTEVYEVMRKISGIPISFKDGQISTTSLRSMFDSYRIDYYKVQALNEYFERQGWNSVNMNNIESDSTQDTNVEVNQQNKTEKLEENIVTTSNKTRKKILSTLDQPKPKEIVSLDSLLEIKEGKGAIKDKTKKIKSKLKHINEIQLESISKVIIDYMFTGANKNVKNEVGVDYNTAEFAENIKGYVYKNMKLTSRSLEIISLLLIHKEIIENINSLPQES